MKTELHQQRLCIHPKEIVLITGYSEGYARKLIRVIRTEYNKQPHQPVTITEVCTYLGLEEEEVRKRLF